MDLLRRRLRALPLRHGFTTASHFGECLCGPAPDDGRPTPGFFPGRALGGRVSVKWRVVVCPAAGWPSEQLLSMGFPGRELLEWGAVPSPPPQINNRGGNMPIGRMGLNIY